MPPPPDRVVRFDDFEFDRVTLELRKSGQLVKLQQQPARVLAALTEHAGDLVSRETLRAAIWGDDTFVDFDRGLNYCINQIRGALGDTAEGPRYLETLRGRGYRFIGAIAPPARSRRTWSWIAAAVVLIALAVLGVRYATARRQTSAPGPRRCTRRSSAAFRWRRGRRWSTWRARTRRRAGAWKGGSTAARSSTA